MSTRQPGDVLAKHLNAVSIGCLISFDWAFPSGVTARVHGELRQIYHTGNDTTVHLTGPDHHTGDLQEFTLQHEALVEVRP